MATTSPRRQYSRALRLLLSITALVAALSAQAQAGPEPDIRVIYFEDIVINNVGAQSPGDEPRLRSELAKEFSKSVIRAVAKSGIAREAQPLHGRLPRADECVLRAVIDVPLIHEPTKLHQNNRYRAGTFLKYRFTLVKGDGSVAAEFAGGLTWGDGNWSKSHVRTKSHLATRIAQPHSEVMKGYIRKAIDRGVAGLKVTLQVTAVRSQQPLNYLSSALTFEDGRP